MAYVIASFLIFVNVIFSYIKYNGKIFAFLLMFFAWMLYWGNLKNPDYAGYTYLYDQMKYGAPIIDSRSSEVGYRAVMKLGVLLKLEFSYFIAIITGISYVLIHSTIKEITNEYNYIYVLYFMFPLMLDIVQIRNFLAMSIFTYSIRFILKGKQQSDIKYILYILLASLFHYSAILYLPFILIGKKENKKIAYGVAIFSVFTSVLIIANDRQIPFMKDVVSIFYDGTYILNWFDSKTNWGFLLFWFIQVLSFLLIKYSKTLYYMNNNKLIDSVKYDFIRKVYLINLMAFMFLPFYLLESTFTRLMRNILLLNYTSFAITAKSMKNKNDKLSYNMIVFTYTMFIFIVQLYLPYKDSIIEAIFTLNRFFGG